jgi:hypothetical protein
MPQDGHPAKSRTRAEPLSTGVLQLIAVDRSAKTTYYIGQMTYQEGR